MKNELILIDQLILKYLKKKDEKAIEMILDNYGSVLKSVIWYHLRFLPVEDREECMNSTLFDIWDNYKSFDTNKGTFKNWISGVAKFNALDILRKNQRRIKTENIDDEILENAVVDELAVMKESIADDLEDALSVLDEKDKSMIIMHYIEGVSIKEIAAHFELKEQNVYKRIERGINKAGRYVNK